MLAQEHLIVPDWPASARVCALQTTRNGGLSLPPFGSLNLGAHVGDDSVMVAANRSLLQGLVPSEPVWMNQVHGTAVVVAEEAGCAPAADACISHQADAVCVVMTADCLPLLLCDAAATVVAAVHAGWRGLADGVIEAAVRAMGVPAGSLMAWLGPAIGPQAFEVGADVRDIFLHHDVAAAAAFVPSASTKWGAGHSSRPESEGCEGNGEKYLADLYLLARQRLGGLGVSQVYGGGFCTHSDKARFYSYRRDGQTGRMASLIWLRSS
ncbi:laccase domain protein YfiH [mine drainage metagenome]|uniref:Laccase domain protein YfiH n=1 Tax=mine drainage metagenome TaxID=410659 RepID=A0A1J5Q9S5_9ZZZZ